MNYFGLFFTFMLPGIALGAGAAIVIRDLIRSKRKEHVVAARELACEKHRSAPKQKLYIYDMTAESHAA